jgi:hypothetical protein
MDSIETALTGIELLKPGEKVNYTQIAEQYNVQRVTLARRHLGHSTSYATRRENQHALHPKQEQELLRYVERLTKQGLPSTRSMIRNFGSQIAKKELGDWADRFVHQYPDKLISKWTTGMDNSRHNADSGKNYSLSLAFYARRLSIITLRHVIYTIWMRRALCLES